MPDVTIYYLEMTSPEALLPKHDSKGLIISQAQIKQYQFNRFLYAFVGQAWQWTDKLKWTNKQWQQYSEADNLHLYVAYLEGSPAGYFELQQEGGNIELMYFGMGEKFIGKGLGGYLLSKAISTAWEIDGIKRLSVNTCSLDHPNALNNYLARGFKLYKTEIEST
ncbi:GNAT family N-acetyltransferase [Shewanella intestini]|uniref:GNAT family N-acetyltransferase n=1 Tax=Shewanella intestini TaxID=2017544 RepID=A0ABS5I6H7_9GAMM|nr:MULTISPECIES: GNAT family N-acetyltransferase [Shewanella]MBR9729501.1 GNAT family N-acetyltransferase [Shewanella intestini]MRG37570.1 GNAT family N-acetyltransferase [Shewanella sp. XMDDZSB0408]